MRPECVSAFHGFVDVACADGVSRMNVVVNGRDFVFGSELFDISGYVVACELGTEVMVERDKGYCSCVDEADEFFGCFAMMIPMEAGIVDVIDEGRGSYVVEEDSHLGCQIGFSLRVP